MVFKKDRPGISFLYIFAISITIVGLSVGCKNKGFMETLSSIAEGTTTTPESMDISSKFNEESSEEQTTDSYIGQSSTFDTTEYDNSSGGDETAGQDTDTSDKNNGEVSGKDTSSEKPTTKEVTTTTTKPPTTTSEPTTKEPETTKPVPEKVVINSVAYTGSNVYESNDIYIDYSNAQKDGYIGIKNQSGSTGFTVVTVTGPDGFSYNIWLEDGAKMNTIVFKGPSGKYDMAIHEQKTNGKFVTKAAFSTNVNVSNKSYTYSSHLVEYDKNSQAVKQSYEICAGKKTDEEKVKAIYDYIVKNIKYDDEKAASKVDTRFPDADTTLKKKKGVCSDYANLFAVMCRAQRIPTMMIYGNINPSSLGNVDAYHAWNQVYYGGKWHFIDTTKNKTSTGTVAYKPAEYY